MRVGGGIPRPDPVGAHRGEGDAAAVRLVEDRLFVVGPGQLDGRVQAGGDAADHGLGEGVGERLDQRGAARPVAGPHPAQVPVELTAGEEVGERVLLDAGVPRSARRFSSLTGVVRLVQGNRSWRGEVALSFEEFFAATCGRLVRLLLLGGAQGPAHHRQHRRRRLAGSQSPSRRGTP
jgi:hypothetical protein